MDPTDNLNSVFSNDVTSLIKSLSKNVYSMKKSKMNIISTCFTALLDAICVDDHLNRFGSLVLSVVSLVHIILVWTEVD